LPKGGLFDERPVSVCARGRRRRRASDASFRSFPSVKKLAESVIREALLCITPGDRPVNVVDRQAPERPDRLS